jgi:hypothetical protein
MVLTMMKRGYLEDPNDPVMLSLKCKMQMMPTHVTPKML